MPPFVEIHQDVRALPGRNFYAGNAWHIRVLLHFQGALDIIMVGDGNPDPQSARPRGNRLDGIAAVGAARMKMHIEYGMIPAQKRQIRFFKKDFFIIRIHHGQTPPKPFLAHIPDNHKQADDNYLRGKPRL
jgi:hypothetical protein